MKNLQTGTTCLSSSIGSKQHKCRRSLQRLATFVILGQRIFPVGNTVC